MSQAEFFNIASYLPQLARQIPSQSAVVVCRGDHHISLSFEELEKLSNRYAHGFIRQGIRRGVLTLVMIKPGIEFVGVIFGLFKAGAVPVLIDSGMGLKAMLHCIRQISPQAIIGISQAHLLRKLYSASFASVKNYVTVGRRWFWGGATLQKLRKHSSAEPILESTGPSDLAAILFTSGSTGSPKGVAYEHGMFNAQVQLLRDHFQMKPGEIELATFPLFALFGCALGMTCVFPEMNFSRPGQANPAKVVRSIQRFRVTHSFGSPALWSRVVDYCHRHEIELSAMKRVLIAGAPVDWRLLEKFRRVLSSEAKILTPYGATEALPIAAIESQTILADCVSKTRTGAGICVGLPVPNVQVRVIRILDEPVEFWRDDLLLPSGRIGEIVVKGPMVTREYVGMPQATTLAKIRDGDLFWHRMGDVGYFDSEGRLWYCGRKSQRVSTPDGPMFTECCEGVLSAYPNVRRAALVGVGPAGHQIPVMVVEPFPNHFPITQSQRLSFFHFLKTIAQNHPSTKKVDTFLLRKNFPVDTRHNAKINRELLALWAVEQSP